MHVWIYSIQFNPTKCTTGKIPYPCEGEKIDGGHAVMACRL